MAAEIRTRRFLVSVSIVSGLLLLSNDLPSWLIAICLTFLGLGLLLDWQARSSAPAWFKIPLFIVGLSAAMAVKGGEAWMALLAVMLSLKPLEGNSYRHMMTGTIFTYFLLAAGVLFHQELHFGLYVLLAVLFNTFVMLRLNQRSTPLRSHLRLVGRIFIRALPVTVLLFLLFPRLPGPIWGYRQQDTAATGFSNQLAPGEFARLVHDRSTAFRVEFSGDYPAHDELYWRGLVLWQNNGMGWQKGGKVPLRNEEPAGENLIEYTVIIEPHNQRLLFSLDLPVRISVPARFRLDHTITTFQRVKRKVRYTMDSNTDPLPESPTDWELQRALQLEPGNPRARELAVEWAAAADSPADLVAMGLNYLRQQDFVYSAEPMPLQSETQVDDFLFRTRQGYCEHYAGAFAFLMRGAGLPARVVTGYQGGEFNTIGKYLVVRQADAHAWTEVWLPDEGWQRIDPTTVVSPARVAEGVEAALPPEQWADTSGFNRLLTSMPFFKSLSMGWDTVSLAWDNWVISYTLRRQLTLFKIFGLDRNFRFTAPLALFAACSLAVLAALLLQYRPLGMIRRKRDPLLLAYRRFCKKLATIGLPRKRWQGPRRYAAAVSRSRPDLAQSVSQITYLYEVLRYATKGSAKEIRQLQELVKEFRPQRRA